MGKGKGKRKNTYDKMIKKEQKDALNQPDIKEEEKREDSQSEEEKAEKTEKTEKAEQVSSKKEKTEKIKGKILFFDKGLEVNVVSKDVKNRIVKKTIEPKKVNLILEITLVAFVALLLIGIFGIVRFIILENSIQKMNHQMEELIVEQESVLAATEREKEELKDKISILTSQVAAQMVLNEEEAQKHLPTALPVTGKVVIVSEPADTEPVGEGGVTPDPADSQIVILGVNKDSKILAAGSGIVLDVRTDGRFGYCVEINHENGYVSLYYFGTEPKVKTGDEVLRGQLLYDVTVNNGRMGYQIILDGEYLNPVDVMEIKG